MHRSFAGAVAGMDVVAGVDRRVPAGDFHACARLARLGFTDPARAERLLASPVLSPADRPGTGRDLAWLPEALGGTADPDLALRGLVALAEAVADRSGPSGVDDLFARLASSERPRTRLLRVLGVSEALADFLARHPGHWRALADEEVELARPTPLGLRHRLLTAVGAEPVDDAEARATLPTPVALDALRVAYRRALLEVAARDLTGAATLADTAVELSDLAGAALRAACAVARAALPADAVPCRFAVIAMGKCGGRELNYVSDVDVIFVAEPYPGDDESAALRTATQLASGLTRVCSTTTAEGTLWEVDAALRPEGRAGPLVRTLASHRAYYQRWAKTWEFQALLKARPVAGDAELGARYSAALAPLVWQAADRDHFVTDVQAMRRRVEENIPRREVGRALKLGPGGLRDVEFAVQLLQLVHGRSDESLRSPTTLSALDALARGGYVARRDAAQLAEAYRFLRALEHRIQLYRLRRSQTMPEGEADLRRLGRAMGLRTDPVAQLHAAWQRHTREVRRIHEKLFYRPLLAAVARLKTDEARLSPAAAADRLEALGYADPPGALRHLQALTAGVSRRASIQRTLLPVMLRWFADAAAPDGGLLAFRQVSDALGATPWYLRLLRDGGASAERMARILASGRLAPDLLLRAPEAVAMLADDEGLRPRPSAALSAEIQATVGREPRPEEAVARARGIRRRELFRIVAADLVTRLDVEKVGQALTDVTVATLAGALSTAERLVEEESGRPLPTRFAVVAMGRFGGAELGYGSDADVLFVHDPHPGVHQRTAGQSAHAVANHLRRLLQVPAPDPPLVIDADLRPEGRAGPLVRSLAAYAAYYQRWSAVWESQALLRAEPVAGDVELGGRFVEMVNPVRWPAEGLPESAVREIRRLKSRVEAERLPRGADPATHTKLGRGGLADVEWTVQLLQLRHAAAIPALRTTRTLAALAAAREAGLVGEDDAVVLETAWRLASGVRNGVMVARGASSDSLPTDMRELEAVARYLGYPPGHAGTLREDYRRATRRARSIVERLFYR